MRNKISYLLYSAGFTAVVLGAAASGWSQTQPQRARNAGQPARHAVRAFDAAGRSVITESTDSERSFTKPSEELELAFNSPGLVTKVTVKDNEPVKKGQVLAEQDVTVEMANKATYEIEANSAVEEEYAIADLELKKVELERKERLFNDKKGRGAVSELEVEEARLNVKRAEASVKLAQQKRQTAAAQAAVEQAKIDLKRIVSPIDGIVQKLDTHPGEVASNATEKPAVKLVRNDPLWIDVNFPAGQAAKLKPNQTLQVRYLTDEDKWLSAQVLSMQPVVRSGSQTRTVRLVMPNPDDVPPGLEVDVRLPDAAVATGPEAQRARVSGTGVESQAGVDR